MVRFISCKLNHFAERKQVVIHYTILDPSSDDEEYIDRHVRDYMPEEVARMNAEGEHCVYLRADGKELQRIEGSFRNIPMARTQFSLSWTGDLVAFIAMNFKP